MSQQQPVTVLSLINEARAHLRQINASQLRVSEIVETLYNEVEIRESELKSLKATSEPSPTPPPVPAPA